jgi:hypothetical protein
MKPRKNVEKTLVVENWEIVARTVMVACFLLT